MGRRFEELGDVCDAHELRLELHARLASGKPSSESAGYVLTIVVSDGADGVTRVSTEGSLDGAAGQTLSMLRRARVVP